MKGRLDVILAYRVAMPVVDIVSRHIQLYDQAY